MSRIQQERMIDNGSSTVVRKSTHKGRIWLLYSQKPKPERPRLRRFPLRVRLGDLYRLKTEHWSRALSARLLCAFVVVSWVRWGSSKRRTVHANPVVSYLAGLSRTYLSLWSIRSLLAGIVGKLRGFGQFKDRMRICRLTVSAERWSLVEVKG